MTHRSGDQDVRTIDKPRVYATRLRRRLRLLRLLTLGGPLWCAVVVGLLLVSVLAPTTQAVLAGRFVAELGGDGSGPYVAAGLLAAVVLAGEASLLGYEVCAAITARRIDGRIRRLIRGLAVQPAHIDHLEEREFQDDAARASDSGQDFGRTRSPGTASVGQLLVVSRYLTALVAAAVLATFSVALAATLLAVALSGRVTIIRQWSHLASVKDVAIGHQRRVGYWTNLAGAAVKEVRLFGLASWLVARRTAAAFGANAEHWRAIVGVLRRQWISGAVLTAAGVAALAVPGMAALRGDLTGGALVRYALAGFVVLSLSQLGPEAFDVAYGAGAVEATDRLVHRYGTAPARVAERTPPPPDTLPVLRFEDVSFGYPARSDRLVLSGLTLELPPGETLAVVGQNGAGKTTMVKLLAGLYQPTSGRITVDGTDVAEDDIRRWQRRVAVLFQDFVRYPASVADNVSLSAPEAAQDEDGIVEALRLAGADGLVRGLPDGLRTSLWREGTGGVDLSGGQWQRIAIARALFAVAHGRQVLVFDEPTAHLDVRTEAMFHRQVVAAVRHAASTVLISHRLSTVRPADRIVLLGDGRVVESGGHEELMARQGRYHRLFTLQAARFAEPEVAATDRWDS